MPSLLHPKSNTKPNGQPNTNDHYRGDDAIRALVIILFNALLWRVTTGQPFWLKIWFSAWILRGTYVIAHWLIFTVIPSKYRVDSQ